MHTTLSCVLIVPVQAAPVEVVRARVLEGMTRAVAEKGYVGVTIADIARQARISKRTFYDHFPDKQSCFLAAYATTADAVLDQVFDAVASAKAASPTGLSGGAGIRAYLQAMADDPDRARVYHIEVLTAGPEALELHWQVNQRVAELLVRLWRETQRAVGVPSRASKHKATAVVGALNELVVAAILEGRTRRLPTMAPRVTDMIRAILSSSL
jgi:AcrR family transcriptional regulator